MKLSNYILGFVVLAVACKRTGLPDVQPTDIGVILAFDAEFGGAKASGVPVSLRNIITGQHYVQNTDPNGALNFSAIPAGTYDIAATVHLSPKDVMAMSGILVEDTAIFNAVAAGYKISPHHNARFDLVLKTGRTGHFVFKEIYFSGSSLTKGAGLRDQFVEVWNNSGDTLYADGLCFAQLKGNVAAGVPNPLPAYMFSDGRYNWQKAIGMPADVDANKHIYTESIYRIPGTGKDVPVAPGKSIILASNAQNHQAPYRNPNGTVVTPEDPTLTVDLSKAEFEVFYGDGFASDVNNPDVPNAYVVQKQNKDMVLDIQGRDGYAIFYYPGDDMIRKKYPDPTVALVNATTTFHIQIPDSLVVDAVDCLHYQPNRRAAKKLGANLDAGFVSVTNIYSSQSFIRKQLRTVNGRIILQDSNNSSADFQLVSPAKPKKF